MIIGAARRTWRDGAPEPLEMWEDVARSAAADAGISLSVIDSVDVVYCQSWDYDEPVDRLAERLGASPRLRSYSGIGGSVPQSLVVEAERRIAAGELDIALVVGGEALATVRQMKKAGERPQWSFRPEKRRPFPIDPMPATEISHSIFEAYLTFALFDSAERLHAGRSLDDHRRHCGNLLAPMSEVAAANPEHAWFPTAHSVDELITPTTDNRMVATPYTKTMVAIMDIDMAAAVIVASEEAANRLGVPLDKRVHLHGAGYGEDPGAVAARPELWHSSAMEAAAAAALGDLSVDDIAHFDLYSCFASSVTFASAALGLADDDPRPRTVTGGLPYHGGPGSNYVTHSLAAMAETLRSDPGSFGLVSGVGMHMAKHSFGVWSTTPGGRPPSVAAPTGPSLPILDAANGTAVVAASTVLYNHEGPTWGALVCDLPGGERCYARIEVALDEDLTGTTVQLEARDGINLARP